MIFIIGQLFINIKRGMVFSPFFHYGMYSEVIPVRRTYGVFEIIVNGSTLQAQNFSAQAWDKIILPLTWYSSIKTKSNSLYYTDIKRLSGKLYITTNERNYLQNCDSNTFQRWYKSYLQAILEQEIGTLNIYFRIYQLNSGHLQPTDSASSLSQICS